MMDFVCENGIIRSVKSDERQCGNLKGVGHVLFERFKTYADRTLQIDGISGEEDTFQSVFQRSIRLALQLKNLGTTSKDTVTICTLNHTNACIPFFASLFLGATLSNLDPRLPIAEATYIMRQIDPKIVFVAIEAVRFMKTVLEATDKTAVIIAFGQENGCVNYFDLLVENSEEDDFRPAELEDSETVFIQFTSGTTSLPKGICLSHRAFLGRIADFTELEDCHRILECGSLYWSSSIFFWGFAAMNGYSKIVLPSFEPRTVWTTIDNCKPDFMFMSPYNMGQLWKTRHYGRTRGSIRKITVGGGSMFHDQLTRYRSLFPEAVVVPSYGLTELGTIIYFQTKTPTEKVLAKEKTGALGRALKGNKYKVVDVESGKTLGPNRHGELRIKSKNQLSGYHEWKSTGVFDDDGFVKTGDIVYYDADFYFYYAGRMKELIKYRSWHVPPKMIENLVMSLEYVSNVCVIGMTSLEDGEHPLAVVEVKTSTSNSSMVEQIHKLVDEKLGGKYKLRGGVKIVKEIPLTVTGKTDLKKTRDMFPNFIKTH